MPTSSHMHFGQFKEAVDRTVYSSDDGYWDDMIAVFQQEMREVYAAGCRYVQLDEVPLPLLCDKNIRELAVSEGDDPDRLVKLYVDVLNRAIAGRPNRSDHRDASVPRQYGRPVDGRRWREVPIADALFNRSDVDVFLMEDDLPRAGDFAPLRYVPAGKRAYLGIISTKNPEIESLDLLMRRIDEAR